MKRIYSILTLMALPLLMLGQGWPSNYGGVMLQGFYWDSYNDSKWTNLESQADELAEFFKLVWIPQSGNCGGYTSMGYDDLYWFTNYNSSFGTKAELQSMINTFKAKGVGTIADVVINHRKNVSNWVDFPAETYKGVTYQLKSTDICRDDDGGAALSWASSHGYSLSSNNDSGEDWSGLRDLDHASTNVQKSVKAYLNMLLNDLGYAGFRYDMTRGYAASYTGLYNAYAVPTYSVGEYWDGNLSAVKSWIDGTKVNNVVQSAAFDFPFRYTVRDAVNNNKWTNLSGTGKGLNMEANYKRYAVTFVENHDTQYRDASNPQDPLNQYAEAANAYMLAMPGTPCVFLKHWMDYKESIKQMIYARQLAGITNTSSTAQQAYNSSSNYYAQRTTGTRGMLIAAMGSTSYSIPSTYVTVLSGTNYRLALSKSTETAWASVPSGKRVDPFQVKLTAVSQTAGAQIVYTLDGSEPTATNGTVIASGSDVTINRCLTLKAGLLINGAVTGVITRNYLVVNEVYDSYEITVYLKDPTVAPNNWSNVVYYCWDSNNVQQCGNWPGETITDTRIVGGVKFYYKTFTITGSQYCVNFVFNQGGSTASSHQTVDVTGVRETSFFEVTTQTNKYQVSNVTDTYLPLLNGDFIRGDVNGDGQVSIGDITDLIDYILNGTVQSFVFEAADLTGDGIIGIGDVTDLIDLILNGA
ncbi:MAG: chitobiase/beta-hexosaminidase C-terminal domain-containing protein [Muribaculaceae bacterium]|nr:chitobiase/beta-hexosaminidase C-terminal domain-containing protein [Muribaculaceae bacterium]